MHLAQTRLSSATFASTNFSKCHVEHGYTLAVKCCEYNLATKPLIVHTALSYASLGHGSIEWRWVHDQEYSTASFGSCTTICIFQCTPDQQKLIRHWESHVSIVLAEQHWAVLPALGCGNHLYAVFGAIAWSACHHRAVTTTLCGAGSADSRQSNLLLQHLFPHPQGFWECNSCIDGENQTPNMMINIFHTVHMNMISGIQDWNNVMLPKIIENHISLILHFSSTFSWRITVFQIAPILQPTFLHMANGVTAVWWQDNKHKNIWFEKTWLVFTQ